MTMLRSGLLRPNVSALVLVRHDLRVMRRQEAMLAPRVVPAPAPASRPLLFYKGCGTAKQFYSMCRTCHPKRNQPARSPEIGYKRGAKTLGISAEEYRQHRESGERWCKFHKRWQPIADFDVDKVRGLKGACRSRTEAVR